MDFNQSMDNATAIYRDLVGKHSVAMFTLRAVLKMLDGDDLSETSVSAEQWIKLRQTKALILDALERDRGLQD